MSDASPLVRARGRARDFVVHRGDAHARELLAVLLGEAPPDGLLAGLAARQEACGAVAPPGGGPADLCVHAQRSWLARVVRNGEARASRALVS